LDQPKHFEYKILSKGSIMLSQGNTKQCSQKPNSAEGKLITGVGKIGKMVPHPWLTDIGGTYVM
jgi:hypothetical protein